LFLEDQGKQKTGNLPNTVMVLSAGRASLERNVEVQTRMPSRTIIFLVSSKL
jgi:hypothetical protein